MADIQLYDFFKENRVRIVIDNNTNEDFYEKEFLDVFTDGRIVTITFKGELLVAAEPICYVQPFKELSAVDLSEKIDGLFQVVDFGEDDEDTTSEEVLLLAVEELKSVNCNLQSLLEKINTTNFHLKLITNID